MINPEIGFFWDILQKDEKSKIKYFLNEIDNFFWDNVNQNMDGIG